MNTTLFENLDIFIEIKDQFDYPTDNKVLFFIKNSDQTASSLLSDIIGATKLPAEHYKIIELRDELRINLGKMLQSKFTHIGIFFGFENKEIGLPDFFKRYQAFQLNSKKLLLSDSLQVLSGNPNSKKLLWSQLKLVLDIA